MKHITKLILAAALVMPALVYAGPKQFDATNTTAEIPSTVIFTARKTGFYEVLSVHTAPADYLLPVKNCVITTLQLERPGTTGSTASLLAQPDGANPEVRWLQLLAGDTLSVKAYTVLCSYDIKYSLHVAVDEFATFRH